MESALHAVTSARSVRFADPTSYLARHPRTQQHDPSTIGSLTSLPVLSHIDRTHPLQRDDDNEAARPEKSAPSHIFHAISIAFERIVEGQHERYRTKQASTAYRVMCGIRLCCRYEHVMIIACAASQNLPHVDAASGLRFVGEVVKAARAR
jgi:hypothetical protein